MLQKALRWTVLVVSLTACIVITAWSAHDLPNKLSDGPGPTVPLSSGPAQAEPTRAPYAELVRPERRRVASPACGDGVMPPMVVVPPASYWCPVQRVGEARARPNDLFQFRDCTADAPGTVLRHFPDVPCMPLAEGAERVQLDELGARREDAEINHSTPVGAVRGALLLEGDVVRDQCFTEYAGADYKSAEADLSALVEATVQQCLAACLLRNMGLEADSARYCTTVVFIASQRRCTLKGKGRLNLFERIVDATAFVLRGLPLALAATEDTRRCARRMRTHGATRADMTVLFAVLTEHSYLKERMVPSLTTWLKDEHVTLLLTRTTPEEHRMSEHLLAPYLQDHPRADVLVRSILYLAKSTRRLYSPARLALGLRQLFPTLKPQEMHSLLQLVKPRPEYPGTTSTGAWKNLPGMHAVFQRYPNFTFYMFIDDDSFVIQRNLRLQLTSVYRPKVQTQNTMIYAGLGLYWNYVVNNNVSLSTLFVQGGAGILFSRSTLKFAARFVDLCRQACDYLPHGDVRTGCCLTRILRIRPQYDTSFWHMHVMRALGRDRRHMRAPFPVSFHRMKNASMMSPLERCVEAEAERLDSAVWNSSAFGVAAGASLLPPELRRRVDPGSKALLPVSWRALQLCYDSLREGADEYKFWMGDLH